MPLSTAQPFEHRRFSIIRQIGAGGMGIVFEAHDKERDVRVALKLLPAANPVALVRFKNEFRSIAEIVHPNLVPLYELISDGAQWFFTMELIDGVDLLSSLNRSHRPSLPDGFDRAPTFERESMRLTGAIDPAGASPGPAQASALAIEPWTADGERQLRTLFERLATGVAFLHSAGVVHRDLKPTNVLVRAGGQPVVLDFGLAASLKGDAVDDNVSGTLYYMAPEQIRGLVPTPAVDWYAIGVMLYEALTGSVPFRGDVNEIIDAKLEGRVVLPVALLESLPAGLGQLCIDLLAHDPLSRPSGPDVIKRLAGPTGVSTQRSEAPAADTALIGREEPLAHLHWLLRRVSGGTSINVHLQGHSGMGKSLLLTRFLEEASEQRQVIVLAGRCFEQESMPFKALDSLLDRLARHLQELPLDELEPLLPPDIAALGLMFPTLLNVPAIAAAPQDVLAIPERRELRQRAFAALRVLINRLAEKHLLVLSIDDLQWGDTDSAAFLSDLLESHEAPRLMLVVAYRTEHQTSPCIQMLARSGPTDGNASEHHVVEVAPLTRDQIQRLVDAVLPATLAGRREWIDRIAIDSGGSPYFAIELSRSLGDGTVSTLAASGQTTLDDVLWLRMQQLPEASLRLLEAVSVAGQPLRADYAYAGGALTDRGQGPMVTLRAERLIRTTGPALSDEIEVYHDRIRETVTSRMDPTQRTGTHARLAQAMEAAEDVDPERIGRHFEAAALLDRAGHHYARAAERAVGALAFERGAVLYRRAMDIRVEDDEQKTRLMIGLAQALANAGRGAEAAPIYNRAAGRVAGAEAFDLRNHAATQYCISGHVVEGRALFGDLMRGQGLAVPSTTAGIVMSLAIHRVWLRLRGLSTATRPEPPSTRDLRRMDLLWSCSTALATVDVLGVAAMQTQCLLMALRAGDPNRIARSLAWEAVMTGVAGSSGAPRAAALLDRAEAVAESIDAPQVRAVVRLAKGWTAFLQVRLRESIRWCEEAEQILHDHCTGAWWEIGSLRTMVAWALVHCGDFSRLSETAPGFLRDATERGDLFTRTNVATVATAQLHLAADRPADARREIDEAMRVWPEKGFDMQHVAELFSTVNTLLYTGEGDEAYARMVAAWPNLRRSLQLANQFTRVSMRDLRARAALAAAQPERRRRLLPEVRRLAARIAREDAPWAEPFARRIEAAVAAADGRRDEAIALLRRAVTGFAAHDLGLHGAATKARLATVVEGSEGAALLDEATRFMQRHGVRRIDRMTDVYVSKMEA